MLPDEGGKMSNPTAGRNNPLVADRAQPPRTASREPVREGRGQWNLGTARWYALPRAEAAHL